jgi:N-acetylglutamate synthase-like GNAT family acetyltransferase
VSIAEGEIRMLIRVGEAGDIEVVVALRYAALSASAPSAYSPREVVELLDGFDVDELRAMIEDRQLFVAETDGFIVGCAGWRGKYLRHVYIAPDLQREGVGIRLVARAESDFRNRTSAAEMYVASVIYARGFYEKLGYELATTRERTGSEPFWMKKRFDVAR